MEIYRFLALQCPFSISLSKLAYKCNTHVSRFSRDIHPQRCVEKGGGFETGPIFFSRAVWQVLSQHGGCLHFTVGRVQPCVAWQRYSRKVAKVVIAHHFFDIHSECWHQPLQKGHLNLASHRWMAFFFLGGSSGRSKLWNTLPILQEPWKWFAETCSTVFYWAYVLKQETLCVYIYISLYRNISASSIHIFICRTSAILDASDCVFDDSMCIPTICCTSLPRNPSTSSTRSQADSHFGCHDGRRRGFGPWGQGHCCQVLRGWVEWGRLIIFTCFFGKMYPIYIYTVGVDLVNCHVFWRGKPTGSFPSHVQQTALRCCVAGIQCFLRVI